MININQVINEEISIRFEDFERKGGCIQFMIFEIKENYKGDISTDEYLLHLVTARQTIEIVNYQGNLHWNKVAGQTNRSSLPVLQTNHELLSQSGKKISVKEFFGYHYHAENRKLIIHGMKPGNSNFYFYSDQHESTENRIDIQRTAASFQDKMNGFANAFLHPPYGTKFGVTIQEVGAYFLDFSDFLFSDTSQISVFEWSTDCSQFFEAGKEWWGSYFWTVHNPIKNWYIGIIASETD